jgi:hypothetical protein
MSDADVAQVIAGVIVAGVVAALAFLGRRDPVATEPVEYRLADGTSRRIAAGGVIPPADHAAGKVPEGKFKLQRRSWLGAILAGDDNRTSTSKSVMFAWTLAIAFGLSALVVAVILGDHGPWDAQIGRGLQEEYLLLLGGPIAAAVLAKYATVAQDDAKTSAPVGAASVPQLVANDSGRVDLGDFQYVVFNAIALLFFFADFVGDLANGFPVLPPLLTGLILTSTGGYAAKKLIAQAAPTLSSVMPAAAPPKATITVFGTNLCVPASAAGGDQPSVPTVLVGSREAKVTAHELVLGNDRLTVVVPENAPAGSAPITAARGDGAAAQGPNGMNALPFEVLPTVLTDAVRKPPPTE